VKIKEKPLVVEKDFLGGYFTSAGEPQTIGGYLGPKPQEKNLSKVCEGGGKGRQSSTVRLRRANVRERGEGKFRFRRGSNFCLRGQAPVSALKGDRVLEE